MTNALMIVGLLLMPVIADYAALALVRSGERAQEHEEAARRAR